MKATDSSRCKVAIIGAGNMAREHIRAFRDTEGVEIVGIHSRSRSKAESIAKEFRIPGIYDSVSDMYDDTEANLVVVAVQEDSMLEVSKFCFEFPWTLLLEKPPGLNVAEAEEIFESAQNNASNALVALNRRFFSSTRLVLDDLSTCNGARFIRVQDQEDSVQALKDGHSQLVVDNWMYCNSIHIIDYLLVFGRGNITRVTPVVPWDARKPGVVINKIEFDSGDIGIYEGLWNRPGPWSVSVSTAEKRWEMRPLESASLQLVGERHTEQLAVHPRDGEYKPGFKLQAEMAVAAAMGSPSESLSLQKSLETMYLVQSIFEGAG
jgi:hypothetical protein